MKPRSRNILAMLWGKILFQHPTPAPLFSFSLSYHRHPPTQSNPHWQCAAPHLSSLLLLFISLSRPHTYRPPGFSLYTLAHMHTFTFGYFVCTLLYFFPSLPLFLSVLDTWKYIRVRQVYMCKQQQQQTRPIFSVLQYRCVGSSHLGPQTEHKVSVCLCVCM